MHYIDTIIAHYGWEGLALLLAIIVLFVIQLYFYVGRFGRLAKYSNDKRMRLHDTPPPISLIIPLFSEDYDYVEQVLPLIMGQESTPFEVVVVYVGSDTDFFDDMNRLREIFSNITFTRIERNERFPISIKTALNVGIKAASHEHILFTTTDAKPTSHRWLSLMARGFQRGDIVLGYCGMEPRDEEGAFTSNFIRASRFEESLHWLSSAIKGRPYRAIRHNMGFTRSLYFSKKGFNRLNMNIGEDDLFLQEIITPNNCSVILSPRGSVLQKSWGGVDWWVDTLRLYRSSEPFYPTFAKNGVAWELTSRVLLFVSALAGLILLPLELKGVVLVLLLVRLIVQFFTIKQVAGRVGEADIAPFYMVYDLVSPLFDLYLWCVMIKRDERVWR